MVNVWASWCVSCRAEHSLLLLMARDMHIPIIGINYKDTRRDALTVLRETGNPYQANAFDPDGRVAIDWGVYGTPESFIIDQQGIIRYKHTGPITAAKLHAEILPLIESLRQSRRCIMKQLWTSLRKSLLLGCALYVSCALYGGGYSMAVEEVALDDPTDEARFSTLANTLRCMVCQNQSIADSNAELARDFRNQVKAKLNAGQKR